MMPAFGERELRNSGIPNHPERSAALLAVLVGAVAGALVGVFAFVSPLWILMFAVGGALLAGGATAVFRRREAREARRDAKILR